MAVNSERSVMVRPSFATNTASGAYKAIIASIFPELNRLSRDGITPSASVGRGKLSDIRVSCSCWLSCHAAMMRIVVVMIATLDELFQWPMRIVFITTENGAMPVVNPIASQGEVRGRLLASRRAASGNNDRPSTLWREVISPRAVHRAHLSRVVAAALLSEVAEI